MHSISIEIVHVVPTFLSHLPLPETASQVTSVNRRLKLTFELILLSFSLVTSGWL